MTRVLNAQGKTKIAPQAGNMCKLLYIYIHAGILKIAARILQEVPAIESDEFKKGEQRGAANGRDKPLRSSSTVRYVLTLEPAVILEWQNDLVILPIVGARYLTSLLGSSLISQRFSCRLA